MITINNKFDVGDHVEYRVWNYYERIYTYHKGRVVGINYISIHKDPAISHAIIEDNKWTNPEEIDSLGVDNDYDYFMKYCLNGESTMAVAWADENDIINKLTD